MQEVIAIHTPHKARLVFAQLLCYCSIVDPLKLFSDNIDSLAEDFRRQDNDSESLSTSSYNSTVQAIEDCLNSMGSSLVRFGPLKHLVELCQRSKQRCLVEEIVYTDSQRQKFLDDFQNSYATMNEEQRSATDMIRDAIDGKGHSRAFVIMAAAGTGKTFVQNAIIQYCKHLTGTNTGFVAVSSTAISAQLLEGGHTAHSQFKLPVEINDTEVASSIEFDSPLSEQLRKARLLIWDEIFGSRKELIEATDNLFKELHDTDKTFGDIVVIASGDLRQTLPKKQKAKRGEICNLCFTRANCFRFFTKIELTSNMRLRQSANKEYADYLLQVGNGTLATNKDRVQLPRYIKRIASIQSLFTNVYGLDLNAIENSVIASSSIIAPLNSSVRAINELALCRLRGEERSYFSKDEELDGDGCVVHDVPVDVLHGINRGGLPLHHLRLKVGAIVMCVRNLNSHICNGTKLRVTQMHIHLVDCLVLTGPGTGRYVTLPRIPLTDKTSVEEVVLRRTQFPITLAYAMTIDKSQGQSLDSVGISFEAECFAHGQLYTALTRCKDPSKCFVYMPSSDAPTNIVWKEVFPST